MWRLKKIQRVMKMTKIELENSVIHPEKVGVKRAIFFQKVIFVKKTLSEVASDSIRNMDTKFYIHKFAHL